MNSINKSVSQVVNAFSANIKSFINQHCCYCAKKLKHLQRAHTQPHTHSRARSLSSHADRYFTENKLNFKSSLNRETQVCLNTKVVF